MITSFRRYSEQIIPVIFLSEARPAPAAVIDVPEEIGLRWGGPSQFDFSATTPPKEETPGLKVEGDEDLEMNGVEVYREHVKKDVNDPDGESAPVGIEAVKSVTFYLGSRDIYREVSGPGIKMIVLAQTVDEYLQLQFPLIAGADEADRGEEPPNDGPDLPGSASIAPAYVPFVAKEYTVPIERES